MKAADGKKPSKSALKDGKGPGAPTPNSFNAVGIVTREELLEKPPAASHKHAHGSVSIAFARSGGSFKLLPRHRERVVDMSLLAHPHVVDEYQGYFKSVKLRSHHGNVQGHLHLCSCRYPDQKTRVLSTLGALAPKAQRAPTPEPEQEMVMPTKSEKRQLFELMDTSGDGTLTSREVEVAISTQWPQFSNAEALKVAIRTADTSNDGTIGRREFGLLLEYLVFFNNLWSKFAILDDGGDGRLDVKEFQKGCKMVNIKLHDEEAAHEFGTMDLDGGGTIVFSEFCVWSARRAAAGKDDSDEEDLPDAAEDSEKKEEKPDGLTLELVDDDKESEEEEKPTPRLVRTPTPPLRSASGRRLRVPELAPGRMTRVPQETKQETKHPSHFTVWMITKHGNSAAIYPHLRNLAHAFMFDSTNLVPILALHRDWLAGDPKQYDPHVPYKTPAGVQPLVLHEDAKPKQQQSMFGAPPAGAKPESGSHGHAKHTPKTPREGSSSHTPKTPRDTPAASKAGTPREPKTPRAGEGGDEEETEEEREEREAKEAKELAVRKLQAHVRGMLGRITRTKLIGGLGGMTGDSIEVQRARERRHLRQTRQEIAVMDWVQELRCAAIAADLPALKEALKHVNTKEGAPGPKLDGATEVGMTALHYACVSGKEEIVMELLEAGADPRILTHTKRAWASHKDDGGGGDGEKKEKKAPSRGVGVHHATARLEKTAADYARENKMFTMQKMCEQRAFDMTRDDERMAMLRKKQEIEERFGAPRSSQKKTYKQFKLQDTTKIKSDSNPKQRSPRKLVHYNAQGERVTAPAPLTVPERHEVAMKQYYANQRVARAYKRPSAYPQFGMAVETAEKKRDIHIHLKKLPGMAESK